MTTKIIFILLILKNILQVKKINNYKKRIKTKFKLQEILQIEF